jgi:hypothetical protein
MFLTPNRREAVKNATPRESVAKQAGSGWHEM